MYQATRLLWLVTTLLTILIVPANSAKNSQKTSTASTALFPTPEEFQLEINNLQVKTNALGRTDVKTNEPLIKMLEVYIQKVTGKYDGWESYSPTKDLVLPPEFAKYLHKIVFGTELKQEDIKKIEEEDKRYVESMEFQEGADGRKLFKLHALFFFAEATVQKLVNVFNMVARNLNSFNQIYGNYSEKQVYEKYEDELSVHFMPKTNQLQVYFTIRFVEREAAPDQAGSDSEKESGKRNGPKKPKEPEKPKKSIQKQKEASSRPAESSSDPLTNGLDIPSLD